MKFPIGFHAAAKHTTDRTPTPAPDPKPVTPVPSLLRVHFPARNRAYSYYNDAFDLHRGDVVYVEGKLAGLRGRVVDVSYNFKIKRSEYKRVLQVADSHVTGQFAFAGSHFLTFDPHALPYDQVLTWFKAPAADPEEDWCAHYNDDAFPLTELSQLGASSDIMERGRDYYFQDKVCYLTLDGTHGRAIVEGSEAYEVEFQYKGGHISQLVCDCYCAYPCKHQVAVLLQLRDTLKHIDRHYADAYAQSGYFAAISKSAFFSFAIDGRASGTFTLE